MQGGFSRRWCRSSQCRRACLNLWEWSALSPMWEFDAVYRREYPGLIAVAAALTGDRDGAQDLVQDTMVKAFIRWDRVSHLDRPGAWCHHVLVNACRSRLRRRATEWRYLSRFDGTSRRLQRRRLTRWRSGRLFGHCRAVLGRLWRCTSGRTCRACRSPRCSVCRKGPSAPILQSLDVS